MRHFRTSFRLYSFWSNLASTVPVGTTHMHRVLPPGRLYYFVPNLGNFGITQDFDYIGWHGRWLGSFWPLIRLENERKFSQ